MHFHQKSTTLWVLVYMHENTPTSLMPPIFSLVRNCCFYPDGDAYMSISHAIQKSLLLSCVHYAAL